MASSSSPFWNKKWGKQSICGITHTRLRPGAYEDSTPRCLFLQCGHGFYTRPLFEWIKTKGENNSVCPLCRMKIDLFTLYHSLHQKKCYFKRINL